MTIYVDNIQTYPTPLKYKQWCHMWTDGNIEELHEMAQRIGLKREWFQEDTIVPHYDLVPSKRKLALQNGAKEKYLREYMEELGEDAIVKRIVELGAKKKK